MDDAFACPMCKTVSTIDDLDEWYASDLMDAVRDDDSTYEEDAENDVPSDRKLRVRK